MEAKKGNSLMKPNTSDYSKMTIEQLEAAFSNLEGIIRYESYGGDHEARANDQREATALLREIKRRKAAV